MRNEMTLKVQFKVVCNLEQSHCILITNSNISYKYGIYLNTMMLNMGKFWEVFYLTQFFIKDSE